MKIYTLETLLQNTSLQDTGCMYWLGRLSDKGYGEIRFKEGGKRRSVKAHRRAYELAIGPIPEGLMICHHCDNPACVNPEHLFCGTALDNNRDMWSKNRQHKSWNARGEERPALARHTQANDLAHLRANVEYVSGCLLWIGKTDHDGFGVIRTYGRYVSAHRTAWTLANGPIPIRHQVRRTCRQPRCIELSHLFLYDARSLK